jgi:hypothetical protein
MKKEYIDTTVFCRQIEASIYYIFLQNLGPQVVQTYCPGRDFAALQPSGNQI